MNKLVLHIKGTRKTACLLICICLLFPGAYLIVTKNNGTFDIVFFQSLLFVTLMVGIALSFAIATLDYYRIERLKEILFALDFRMLGDKNLQLIDQYTGWNRDLKIVGTYNNRKVSIDHGFEKGDWGSIPYLTIATAPDYRIILEIKVDKYLTTDHLDTKIREALATTI